MPHRQGPVGGGTSLARSVRSINPGATTTAVLPIRVHGGNSKGAQMSFAATQKFIREHLFELLITALVSLGGVLGTYLLASIRGNLDQLQCRMSEFAAKSEFNSVQLKLIVTPLDDVKGNSDFLEAINKIISGYKKPLSLCPEGIDAFAQIENYKDGLDAYVDRNWDQALEKFELIKPRNALSEKSMASALLHKYFQLKAENNPKAFDFEQRWKAKIASAYDLSSKESDYAAKETAVLHLECTRLFLDADTAPAVQCLQDLVNSGRATYVDYYNLAALSARNGDFKTALDQMRTCMKSIGSQNQRRSDIEADEDFKNLLHDPTYAPNFRKLIGTLGP
jgi:hypothetical protein